MAIQVIFTIPNTTVAARINEAFKAVFDVPLDENGKPINVTELEFVLEQLTPGQKNVVLLKSKGWTYKRIGLKMGITAEAVRRLHKRARLHAQDILR